MTRLSEQSLPAEVALYKHQTRESAEAEAAHKKARAKRMLEARHSGEAKSVAEAECIAEADDAVADLFSRRLITAALAESTKQSLMSMREATATERTEMAGEREADKAHAMSRWTP